MKILLAAVMFLASIAHADFTPVSAPPGQRYITDSSSGSFVTTSATNTWTGSQTFSQNVTANSSVTASAFFGNGVGMTGVTISTKVYTVGSSGAQFTTVGAALSAIGNPSVGAVVLVTPGTYSENIFSLPANVSLSGTGGRLPTLNFASTAAAITVSGTNSGHMDNLIITNTLGPAIRITGSASSTLRLTNLFVTGFPALVAEAGARPIRSLGGEFVSNGSSAAVVLNGAFSNLANAGVHTFDTGSSITASTGQDALTVSTNIIVNLRNVQINRGPTTTSRTINFTVPGGGVYAGQINQLGNAAPSDSLVVSSNTVFSGYANGFISATSINGFAFPASPKNNQYMVATSSTGGVWSSSITLSGSFSGTSVTATSSVTASGYFGASMSLTGTASVGSGANTVYYCSGSTAGTFDGNLARGNGNAGACAGGTWIAVSLQVD